MAYKYREELVGKRFLSVSGPGKFKLSKICEWEWRAGVIRAASHRNPKHSDLSVLVEFDDVDWKRREWIRVYDENVFQVFAIEKALVWLPRKQQQSVGSKILSTYWPGVSYKFLLDNVGLSENRYQPVEYLVNKDLTYVDYSDLKPHQVDISDSNCLSVIHNHPEVAKAIGLWSQYQDGQRILLTTPSVLVGYRVEVYRAEGTTQWYTAVIVSYNENTKELTLTDDTVLEEHNEDPSLVQMRLIGDGVVESILRGENIGITPRRRSCTTQQHLGHYTRTRSQLPSQLQCHRTLQHANTRKSRVRSGNEVDSDKEKEKGSSFVKDKKIKNSSGGAEQENQASINCEIPSKKNQAKNPSKSGENCVNKSNQESSASSNGSNRISSDLESDIEEYPDYKANHHHHHHHRRKQQKGSHNAKSNCANNKQSDVVPNPREEPRDKSSKSHLKPKLKGKSLRDKSAKSVAVKLSQQDKSSKSNNTREECGSGALDSESDVVVVATRSSNKVKKCSVIVDYVERHSEAEIAPKVDPGSPNEEVTLPDDGAVSVSARLPSPDDDSADNRTTPALKSQPSQPIIVDDEQRLTSAGADSENEQHRSEQNEQPQLKSHSPVNTSDQMSPVPYVKVESENVINGEQSGLSCPPTSPSLVLNNSNSSSNSNNNNSERATSNDNSAIEIAVLPTKHKQGYIKDVDAKGNPSQSVIKVRKVEETSSSRLSSINSLVLDPNEPVTIWRDPKLVGSNSNIFHITSLQHSTMAHPASSRSHQYAGSGSASAAGAAGSGGGAGGSGGGGSQHSNRTSSSLQSHFPPPPHLPLPPHASSPYMDHPRIPAGANPVVAPQPPPPQPSAPSPHQYPPHMLAQHHIMSQYPPLHNMDLVWPQKFPPQVQPWMIPQYADERERAAAAAILQERERQARLLERERREQADQMERKEKQERMERERREQEKLLEKEKLERERMQKEREKQMEMERIKKEKAEKEREREIRERERLEHERAQQRREVHQHFEESFRLAQYKAHHVPNWGLVPRQPMMETAATNSSHHSGGDSSRRISVVHGGSHSSTYPPGSGGGGSHKATDLSKDGRMVMGDGRISADPRYLSPEEHRRLSEEEKWSVMKRQQEAAISYNSIQRSSDPQQRSSSAHSYPPPPHDTGQSQNSRTKDYGSNPNFSPAPKSSSVPVANNNSNSPSGSVKSEPGNPSFNLYGYQPFHHTYILQDRRGPMVANVPDNHKFVSAEMVESSSSRATHHHQSATAANVPPSSSHGRSGRCSPPHHPPPQMVIQEAGVSSQRRRNHHGSVIVCSDNTRIENCNKAASPIMSPKQVKIETMYDNVNAYKSYELAQAHGQSRMAPQLHSPYAEPQNFHKSGIVHAQEQAQYASRIRTSVPAPTSNYGPNVASPSPGKSSSQVSYPPDLVQQGLVPNPMYNQSSTGGSSGRGVHHNNAPVSTSPSQKLSGNSSGGASKMVNQMPNSSLSLPARSSPGAMYSKASIVAGTSSRSQQATQPPNQMGYSMHTPPPAHGGRTDLSRPSSAHSQAPLPPAPHTAMSGQTSHSPIERNSSRSGERISSQQQQQQQSHPELMYSSAINMSLSPHIASPHVPSPIPMNPAAGYGVQNQRRPSPMMMPSPPQTQPLDLQAPDRQRDSRSASPGKRKSSSSNSSKDISHKSKRPKTVVMSVANEGLAAAVASVHQIMSNNASVNNYIGPRTTNAPSSYPPHIISSQTAIPPPPPPSHTPSSNPPSEVNTSGLDTLVKTALANAPPVTSANFPSHSPSATSPNKDSGFLESFRSFVNTSSQQQQNQMQTTSNSATYAYGKHKAKHLATKSNVTPAQQPLVSEEIRVETPGKSIPATTTQSLLTAAALTPPKTVVSNSSALLLNGPTEQPEKAVSPALSNASSTSTCGVSIPKLKKEWLIRHSNEDGKNSVKSETNDLSQAAVASIGSTTITAPSIGSAAYSLRDTVSPEKETASNVNNSSSNNNTTVVATSSVGTRSAASSNSEASVNGHINAKSETNDSNSVDDSETESVSTTSTIRSASKRATRSKKRKAPKKESRSSKSRHIDHSDSIQDEDKDMDMDDEPLMKRSVSTPRKRGRKPKSKSTRADAVRKTKSAKSSSSKIKKPSIARLKRTGESFLQKGPCCEVAPKLSKCRECRMTQFQRNKKMPNIFCRFYEFRRLKYTKNGFITHAGFSEPKDASEEDLKLWLPPVDNPAPDLKVETSYFILTHVGDQFCDLVEQEREAQAMHMSEDKTIAWKQVVQGVREMCDVCETTLFNIHWACNKCGFVVCIDCYKARRNGTVKEEENSGKDRDAYSWLMCNSKQMHEQEKLILTQIIAGNALWDMGRSVHEIRKKWDIANYCCNSTKSDNASKKPAVNGLCKQLMSAVSKCFGPDVINEQTNGGSEAVKSGSKISKSANNVNGSMDYVKQEAIAGYNHDGSSPLSWLADVALHTSIKLESGAQKNKENHRDGGSDSKDSLKNSPSYSSDTDDGKNSENYSTLRELLIRPTSKNSTNKNSSTSPGSKKKSTLDEVISHVIEQSVNNVDKPDKISKEGMKLVHYTKRFPHHKHGREPLPIRVFTLEESKVLYPDVPHSWLCNGRLLRLVDPDHEGNLQLFQEQWKRGQPVLVSEINKRLDIDLWHPDSFARDYGDKKNDLVNCSNGSIVPNQPMRKFWEGFETFAKRMKDDNGEYMLLKLKDWPPGDDFSEMLPSRFEDLMKALPLPEYTHRNGLLNIAGRLPECFVRPDLGPKMYNAYGSAMYPDKGTTNLHLDISDAVNVMVYVGIPKDSDNVEHMQEALRAIEEGGCDTITLRRVREKGSKPGALWHIYNARDADKIRDLLNKVAVEKGNTLEAHHDPIHDQSWYLDGILRDRLYKEYGVEGYAIAQCLGDAVFIPAGAPHQVRNLHSCIKVAEDFVSPENISHCFTLTQEFRDLSDTHTNHEDKLQVKNIIYHAVRDALALLMTNDPSNFKDLKFN